jgi:hypothetical protein
MGALTDINQVLQRRLSRARYQVVGAANSTDGTFYMLVDLSNASGKWKHKQPTVPAGKAAGIRLYGVHMALAFPTAADLYRIDLGVVLEADATDGSAALMTLNAGFENYFPNYLDFTVSGGDLKNAFGTKTLVDSNTIQTDVNMVDAQGNNVLPAVGDLIFRVISTKGSPTGSIAMADVDIWYDVVAS